MIEISGGVTAAEVLRMIEERRTLAQSTTDADVLRALVEAVIDLQRIADDMRQTEERTALAKRWRHNAEILEGGAAEPVATPEGRADQTGRARVFRRCADDLLEQSLAPFGGGAGA